jgi:hypothetical protein
MHLAPSVAQPMHRTRNRVVPYTHALTCLRARLLTCHCHDAPVVTSTDYCCRFPSLMINSDDVNSPLRCRFLPHRPLKDAQRPSSPPHTSSSSTKLHHALSMHKECHCRRRTSPGPSRASPPPLKHPSSPWCPVSRTPNSMRPHAPPCCHSASP